LKKLIPISGDVSLSNLGISPTDMQELIDNVSVVFHLAARIKLDDNLREAMDCNVKGPKRVAILCRQLKNLQVCIYIFQFRPFDIDFNPIDTRRRLFMFLPLTVMWIKKSWLSRFIPHRSIPKS
jgi:hypothetical protein